MKITRSKFRIFVVVVFLLSILSGFADVIFQDSVIIKLNEYAETLEPEIQQDSLNLIIGALVFAVIYLLYSFIGLILFWNMARHVYLVGFVIILPMEIFMGPVIMSGLRTFVYDFAMVLCGFLLALIYSSPVNEYFTVKSNKRG